MIIHVFETQEALDKAGATLIASQLLEKPESVLGLATGSSPIGIYRLLSQMNAEGVISFSMASSYNLDEYIGLEEGHPETYRSFMARNLFDHVDIDPQRTHFPNNEAGITNEAVQAYDKAIDEAGGIDLQLLGIGGNGHIGFNEPADTWSDTTMRVQLAESTIQANSRFFDSIDQVPTEAVSMGIGTISKARKIVLIASGEAKAEAIRAMAEGEVTPQCPASILQNLDNVIVLVDRDAASRLSEN